MLEIAILKNFNSGTYKAGVQLAGSLTTYFDDISVAKNIPSSALVIGNCVILAIPGGNPKDACLIAAWPQGSPGGGAGSFLDLSDTPSSYSDQARKLLAVNGGEDALEFISGKAFYALTVPKEVYVMKPAVSSTPRTATINSVSGDTITLTDNHAYRFFDSLMEGNSHLKIANTSKNPSEYAWVKTKPAANQLQVTESGDISGWANGETISTAEDGATSNRVEVDLSPLLPEDATGIFCSLSVRDSGTIANNAGRCSISPDGSTGTFQHCQAQVTDILNDVYPFVPVDSNLHVVYRDNASGTDTLSIWSKLAGYVK